MYSNEIDKKERQKVIAIAAAVATLILVLVVAIIVVATNKPAENVGGNENTEFIVEEEQPVEEEKTEEILDFGSLSTEVEETVPDAPEEITSTGPGDVLPIALLAGGLTTVLTSVYLNRKQA